MAYFDFLIDKENKAPKDGMEYIYLMDMIWKPCLLESFYIPKGEVMINVIQKESGGYGFIHKASGEKYETNYGWALAENTPENVERIKEYNNRNSYLSEIEKEVEDLRNKIVKLK